MFREQAFEYRNTVSALLKEIPNKERRTALDAFRDEPEYAVARSFIQAQRKRLVIMRGFTKPSLTEIPHSNIDKQDSEAEKRKSLSNWANEVADTYVQLPKATRKDKLAASIYLKKATAQLLENPDNIPPVVLVWKNYQEKSASYETFYLDARGAFEESARIDWSRIPPETLGELLRVGSHDINTADFSKAALRGYFKGGESLNNVAIAMHKFTFGALSLGRDYQGLRLAYDIATFKNEEILPISSTFGMNYLLKANLGFDDKPNFRKLYAAGLCWGVIAPFIGSDLRADSINLAVKATSRVPRTMLQNQMMRLVKILGGAEIVREFTTELAEGLVNYDQGIESSYGKRNRLKEYVGFDFSTDPLMQRLKASFGAATGYYLESRLYSDTEKTFPSEPLKVYYLPIGNQKFAYTVIPSNLKGDVLTAFEDKIINDSVKNSDPSSYSSVELGDMKIGYFYGESATRVEGGVLGSLALIGVPVLTVDGELPTLALTSKLAGNLYQNQRVFLDKRGIKVNLDGFDPMTEQGYKSVTFKKSGQNIVVEINGVDFTTKTSLDRYFALKRSEGFHSPLAEESLYLLLLNILSEVLLREPQNGGAEDGSEGLHEIISRMPHLRLLPLGQNFSMYARKNYLEEQGLDLQAMSEIKKTQNENDPVKAGRNTTYVSAVTKEGYDKLAPIELNICDLMGKDKKQPAPHATT